MAKNPLVRNVISMGLTPEVRRVIEDYIAASGRYLTAQEAVRELVLLGSGVECDAAMLLIARQQIRRRGEAFLMRKLADFVKSLDAELKTYLDAATVNGDGE